MFDQNTLNSAWGGTSVVPKAPPPKQQGGVAGFLGTIAHGAVSPFEYLINTDIINPVKELSADFTGNKVASANAMRNSNINLGLGASGKDIKGGVKKFIGNSAQALLTPLAPGAGSIKAAATLGAGAGASSALAEKDSTVGDVLAGGLVGGATGGALGGIGKVISKVAPKSGAKEGGSFLKNLTTQGQQAQGRVAGVSAGSKVAGRELTPQDTEQMLSTLKQEGIKTGNANNTLRDVTDKLKGYGQQIADHFKTNDNPLKLEDTKVIASNFIDSLKTTDPRILKEAEILGNDLQKNVKSTKDLWEFRKSLDSRIPDIKQATDVGLSNKIAATKAMRQYIADELGSVPGMSNYRALSEVKPFISAEAKRLNNPGGGIIGRVLSSGPVQKIENTAGKVGEKVGNIGGINAPGVPGATSSALSPAINFASGIFRQGASAEAGKSVIPGQETVQPQSAPDMSAGLLDNGTDVSGTTQQDTSPFAPSNIEGNIQRIIAQGGTMKDVSEYLSNAKAYNDLVASASPSTKPVSATAADAIANAQSALSSIDTIEQQLTANPSIQGKNALSSVANPFGITSRLAGTGEYDAALNNAKDVIGRLRTGAAITNTEEGRFTAMLPQPADTPEVVAQKLKILKDSFNAVVQRVGGNSSDLLQEAAQAAQ